MRILWFLAKLSLYGLLISGGTIIYLFYLYSADLPDYKALAKYDPPVVTRFYSADGKLLEEYAKEHRLFVPIKAMPKQLINAFISAEDKNFYEHPGIDITSIMRAGLQNAASYAQNKRGLYGGSTITQQVVKNFLVGNERSIARKVKEAILAFRISAAFSKDQIMELYLNDIYLGAHAYGVASAALSYFNKSINELTIEESAFLAALPKAPSFYHPKKNYDRALARRNWVIERMYEDGYITKEEAKAASAKPIMLRSRDTEDVVKADFFAESVRRKVQEMYGEDSLYKGGLYVRTSLDPKLQSMADIAFKVGLARYDQRRGYRGPLERLPNFNDWKNILLSLEDKYDVRPWNLGIVNKVSENQLEIQTLKGVGIIPKEEMAWALGKAATKTFAHGDVIVVENKRSNVYALRQIPKVNGGMVVMDPDTGRILAIVGGFSYKNSQYNRAMQALRQTGSVYKTFVYLSALENGFTPSSIIEDSPIEVYQGPGMPLWRPKNYHEDFLGPTTLRRGLELSRNTMTVNIAQMLGIDRVVEITKRFNISPNPPHMFSLVLGALEAKLVDMTTAYAMLVNGGKRITPSLIDRVQDRNGKIIFVHDSRECVDCKNVHFDYRNNISEIHLPLIMDERPEVTDPRSAYQIVSILQGAVEHTTTLREVKAIGKTLGGKTGTTNDSKDTWFIGFSPNLVVGVYVGYDEPKSLGKRETGATVAMPIFVEFMNRALKDVDDIPFKMPDNMKQVKIDYMTGLPSRSKTGTIYEAYKVGTEPNAKAASPSNIKIEREEQDLREQEDEGTGEENLEGIF